MSACDDLTAPAADMVEVTTDGYDIDVQAQTSIGGPGRIVVHDACARLDLVLSASTDTRTLTDVKADTAVEGQIVKILAATTDSVRIWILKS